MKLINRSLFFTITLCITFTCFCPHKKNKLCQNKSSRAPINSLGNFPLLTKSKGTFNYTDHIKERMDQRNVDSKDVEWVMRHGNQYNGPDRTQLRVDTEKKVAVVLSQATNTLITVYNNFDSNQLDRWLERRKKS